MNKHGRQPLVWDGNIVRFQENPIVRYLLDNGGIDMNQLYVMGRGYNVNSEDITIWTDEDRSHFAQLIGYSTSGYGELSYVDPNDAGIADQETVVMYRTKEENK